MGLKFGLWKIINLKKFKTNLYEIELKKQKNSKLKCPSAYGERECFLCQVKFWLTKSSSQANYKSLTNI